MPVSVRLPALTAAQHQCTIATTSPAGAAQWQLRFAGTTPFTVRGPNGIVARVDQGQLVPGTSNVPTGGSVVELCLADGTPHEAIITYLRDAMTYIRANNPSTDQMSAPEMERATRIILDFVRTNGLKAL